MMTRYQKSDQGTALLPHGSRDGQTHPGTRVAVVDADYAADACDQDHPLGAIPPATTQPFLKEAHMGCLSFRNRDLEVLWEDGERVFCRDWRLGEDGCLMSVLVVLADAHTPVCDRFAHEFRLKDVVEGAWAVRPLVLEHDGGRTALVLEDGGDPLDRLSGPSLELGFFLRLAIAMASAVGRLHQRGIVHKDIKPGNFLVDREVGAVRLTGFGIASCLLRERQAPDPPETIAGSLPYMAPEQTGRMNRSVDSRADLYALGVTLYQMVTGSLPFTAGDPMEWVHCHIARIPASPRGREHEVPAAVAAIIMKLLAKTPEDRYQTAGGVERDLRRCLTDWEAEGRVGDAVPGRHDVPDRLLIPEKLYGRQRDVDTLLAAFDRIVDGGAPELVLVTGYSGIGKSSVVNELHKVLVPSRGLFAAGKFDQYKRDIPYSTLAQAFQDGLIRPLLGKSDAELLTWRHALLEALGANAQLMVDLVPDLILVIGNQPPVPELSLREAKARFQLVLRRFIGVFARPEHPLALFLDDLQWLDAATLDLIEDLLTGADLHNLLLIGAYRDNEVGAAHPLARKLQAIRSAGAELREITLAPLAPAHLGRLIADALRCDAVHAAPLAQLVHERTGGNPFFATRFVSQLADDGLLYFEHDVGAWAWDLNRIRAKGPTDNVVDLMVGKLSRLPAATQKAMQQLACVGNTADIAVLSIAFAMSEHEVHADLWEAVRQELVEPLKGSYRFVHDRVHEAAYSLIPPASRASAHLRIGRLLAAQASPERLQETIFEIVNHLNRGVALITLQSEREQLADLNLIAARRAKAAAAYASACIYLGTGMSLLSDDTWTSRYPLAFGLRLERAECQYLNGNFEVAERLITELLARATSKIDKSAAYRIKVDLLVVKSENGNAVDSALKCLRLFGIDIPPHPTREEVDAEYQRVWIGLAGRPIESLIDLPVMTDPETKAAMDMLSVLYAPAYFTDVNLLHLLCCRMVNLTLRQGRTDASAHAYAQFGVILASAYHRFDDSYRFGKIACELVEKHDLVRYKANAIFSMEMVALWTQPVESALGYIRASFKAAVEAGNLSRACYCCNHVVADLLLRGDHLDEIWDESERALDFIRRVKFRDQVDIIVSQQRFIAAMRGRTAHFSTFNDATFDEETFEAQLTVDPRATMVCWYWILKLQARFMAGDYETALAAADNAQAVLWSADGHIRLLDYYCFTALAMAAAYETATPGTQRDWRETLATYLSRLGEWAEKGAATFHDRYALVAAEVARIEGRPVDAIDLYEQAIRSAQANSFVHGEALANELAARFHARRGLQRIADVYLRNARQCYARWGAHGKVRQLDEMHPHLLKDQVTPAPTSTMGIPVEHLDLVTVIRVSQAVAGEMVPHKLRDTLMRTALEQAGAERGLLILLRGAEPWIAAEASVFEGAIRVRLPDEPAGPAALPQSVLHYVLRTRKSVVIDDAATQPPFCGDVYVRQKRARSVVCVPLINHGRLTGALYVENNLSPRVFAPTRITLLKFLAAQAAISLENTRLYDDLAQREAKIRRLVDANIIGIIVANLDGRILEANDAFLDMVGYERDDLTAGRLNAVDLTPPEWPMSLPDALYTTYEKEYFRKDGSRVPVLVGRALLKGNVDQAIGFVLDLSERKRAEAEARESDQRYREAQTELARANRIAIMGELAASIVHEVNQPLTAVVSSAEACLRWMNAQKSVEARRSMLRIRDQGIRAAKIVDGMRALIEKAAPQKDWLDVNGMVLDVVALIRSEIKRNALVLETRLSEQLPNVLADRIQLQQVVINLMLNAIEAMTDVEDRARVMVVCSDVKENHVVVSVQDSGLGLDPDRISDLFDAFYTTKTRGTGMGLSISRSIVNAHDGQLWAEPNAPRGAIFRFSLPIHTDYRS